MKLTLRQLRQLIRESVAETLVVKVQTSPKLNDLCVEYELDVADGWESDSGEESFPSLAELTIDAEGGMTFASQSDQQAYEESLLEDEGSVSRAEVDGQFFYFQGTAPEVMARLGSMLKQYQDMANASHSQERDWDMKRHGY